MNNDLKNLLQAADQLKKDTAKFLEEVQAFLAETELDLFKPTIH